MESCEEDSRGRSNAEHMVTRSKSDTILTCIIVAVGSVFRMVRAELGRGEINGFHGDALV